MDELNDFIAFSVSDPFASWFTVSGHFPKAFGAKTEHESRIFSTWSTLLIRGALTRLGSSARWQPYVLRAVRYHHDDLPDGSERLQGFYDAMAARPATKEILAMQAQEFPTSRQELFRDFGAAYDKMLNPGRMALSIMFGHDI